MQVLESVKKTTVHMADCDSNRCTAESQDGSDVVLLTVPNGFIFETAEDLEVFISQLRMLQGN